MTSFDICNYLLKPVRVDVKPFNKPVQTFAPRIRARGKMQFSRELADKYFLKGSVVVVYILGEKKMQKFSTYTLDIPEGTSINKLHIGMITSRWVGADSDMNIGKPGLNAVQGLPWIKIHNMSDVPLSLNHNIDISPNGTLRYTGRDHFGVRLGTVFDDQDGIYPRFIWTIPATDVYYGVVSDLQQPLFGGHQLSPEFLDAADEPHYLLENGWVGGPAKGNIPIGFVPREGRDLPPVDRWGNPIRPPASLSTPVGPGSLR